MDLKGRKQPVTIYDIAFRAGVSPATVSRVLRGAPYVAPAKRAAVSAAAEALHYRPNLMAQDLASGRSRTVGMVLPDPESCFWGGLLKGVEAALRASSYHLLMATAPGPDGEPAALDLLLSHQVDGLVLAGTLLSDEALLPMLNDVPFVTVCRRGAAGGATGRIVVHNRAGARELTRHLIRLGHRRIAHICGPLWQVDAAERREGFLEALAEARIEAEPQLVVEADFSMRGGLVATQDLLAVRPGFTALFAGNDEMALGAFLALDRHGLQVPRDVSVAGYDDDVFAEFCRPPLTTVRQPMFEIGRAAVGGILARVRGENTALPSFSPTLRVRESTAPVAVSARRSRRKRA
jgi:LacI family transcriptional regulator, galactose operon repressor